LQAVGLSQENFTKSLIGVVAFAFAIRFAVRCYSGADDFWKNGYGFFFELAQNIAAGNGVAFDGGSLTTFRVPLYAIFLAALTFGYKLFLPVVIVQSLVGAGTVLCAALLAQEMFGMAAALIAAVLTAIYPYYVLHDTALQETSLFTFLTILALLLLVQGRQTGSWAKAMWAGLALGAMVLTRANLAPFAMVAPLWLALPERCGTMRLRLIRNSLSCAAIMALTISPWLLRSYWLTGSASLTTQSGYFLWLGNNPLTFGHYPSESIDKSEEEAVKSLSTEEKAEIKGLGENEAIIDQWYRNKAIAYMSERPWQTFFNGLRKIEAAFAWLPSPRKGFWGNFAHLVSYGPVMILGLWGMWSTRWSWRLQLPIICLFVSFAGVTAVFFGHTNYRSYLDVYWIVFAAGMLAHLLRKQDATGSSG
jgi:4-amino-4-deoxy-L-arabinose transferase-like glycosyltransferase